MSGIIWKRELSAFLSSVLRNSDPRRSNTELGGRICSESQTEKDTEFYYKMLGKYSFIFKQAWIFYG